MRALILAAGRGSRMGEQTAERPKGLLPLRGRPLIRWQIEALAEVGVRELAIVRGYRGELLRFDATTFEHPRWAATSSAGSLARAESWLLADDTIVSYADIVYSADLLRGLLETPGDIVLPYDARWEALWRRRFEDPLSDAETFWTDGRGRLLEIGARPTSLEEVRGQYMGLFKLTPRGARRLLARLRALAPEQADRTDMTALFRLLLEDGEEICTLPFEGWWCEVDRPSDLALAEEIVAREVPS